MSWKKATTTCNRVDIHVITSTCTWVETLSTLIYSGKLWHPHVWNLKFKILLFDRSQAAGANSGCKSQYTNHRHPCHYRIHRLPRYYHGRTGGCFPRWGSCHMHPRACLNPNSANTNIQASGGTKLHYRNKHLFLFKHLDSLSSRANFSKSVE